MMGSVWDGWRRFLLDMTRRHPRYALFIIMFLGFVLRLRWIDLCEVGDRGQVVLGMTNNLPPLYHYFSIPFLWLTDNLWYSPAFANLTMAVLCIYILYLIGRDVKGINFGLLMAFFFAFFPTAILHAREISPEQTELFAVILIIYFYIRLEIVRQKENKIFWLLGFFLALSIGAFSKQQTLFVLVLLFIFGIYKHRIRIFRKELYYVAGLAALPYCFFLLAHPEMLAAVVIYFVQPSGQTTVYEKLASLGVRYLIETAPYLLVFIAGLVCSLRGRRKEREQKNVLQEADVFFLICFVVYNLFLIKTLPSYFYLLVLPMVYFIARFFSCAREGIIRTSLLILLAIYTVFGFFLLIQGFSLVTTVACEVEYYSVDRHFVKSLLDSPPSGGGYYFHSYGLPIYDILEGEKYLLIGGNTGQDLKYNLDQRLYYAGVMNTDRYNDINYALLVYPIDTTYTGAPAWDYPYLEHLLKHSEVVFNDSNFSRQRIIYRITNHTLEGLEVDDFRTRSIKGLKLEGKV